MVAANRLRTKEQEDYIAHDSKAGQLFRQLVETGSLPQDALHWLTGWLSGFPECCIDFWVNEWSPFVERHTDSRGRITQLTESFLAKEWPKVYYSHIGYIPCPECAEKL